MYNIHIILLVVIVVCVVILGGLGYYLPSSIGLNFFLS